MSYFLRSKGLKGLDVLLYLASCFTPYEAKKKSFSKTHPKVLEFIKKHGYLSSVQPLAGRVSQGWEELTESLHFLEKLAELIPEVEQRELAGLEFLAKVIAYRDLPVGTQIPLPESGGVNWYQVHKVFDLEGGMPAFGLVPQGRGDSILLFRGTDGSFSGRGIASIFSMIDLSSPGFSVYQRARRELRLWLDGKRARAVGFGLGGSLAMLTTLYDGEVLHPALPSVAFNPPGIYSGVSERVPKSKLTCYVRSGDLISHFGELVGEVRVFSSLKRPKPIEAHEGFVAL